MKKINLLSILTVFAFISSMMMGCGSKEATSLEALIASGDMKGIQAKKKELSQQQKALALDIAKLDSAIGATEEGKNLPLVTTFKANLQDFSHYIELRGDVNTKQNVLIYPEMAGTLLKVYVKEGQNVQKGALLATIDDGGMKSQLLQLETQLALAKTTFERQERLWNQKIGSEIQFLQAKTNYESQEKAVEQMKEQIEKYSIRAPFTGVIDDIIKDQGTVVAPGGPGSEVFRIVNLSNMFLEVSVPEAYIGSIVPGKKVRVQFPILGKTIESRVRQTGNFINPQNRSFTAEIPVPNPDGLVKPNLTATVLINDYSNDAAILIPQSIISENADGDQYAFVAANVSKDNVGLAQKNIITTGKTQGDMVEILSGIDSGANIIEEGARSVKDGQKVKILN